MAARTLRASAARLFPRFVSCELRLISDDCAPVHAEERRALAGAAAIRRREFACGRACAHRALHRLGAPDVPILIGSHREPLWPPGFVGAIAHTRTLACACAAAARDTAGLGLDVEDASTSLDAGQRRLVFSAAEAEEIASLRDDLPAAVLIFSAKEAVFKALFPHTGVPLEFADVQVTLDVAGRSFEAAVHRPQPSRAISLGAVAGRFDVVAGQVLTAVTLPAASGAAAAPRQ